MILLSRKLTPTQILKKQMDKSSEKQSRPNNLSEFNKECKDYEAMKPASSEEKVLDWWRGHQEELPILSTLARFVLASPGF